MNEALLSKLKEITAEEKEILKGSSEVQSKLYTSKIASPSDFTVDCNMLLKKGKLIDVRPHTRFVHFPNHRHNYVELVYMCSGSTTHIINGKDTLVLKEGDLLFLNRNATHEILPASEDDIAVNFIILPEFFDRSISMIESENILRDFLLQTLSPLNVRYSYLHFSANDILPVLNLLENIIWTIFSDRANTNSITATTMGLLFMNLSVYAENINKSVPAVYEQNEVFTVLKYIETHYKSGTLQEISAQIKQPTYYVSRLLKKHLDKNFKELLQERKLQQAEYLLSQSSMTVEQIMDAVGYDNSSYFYNRFKEKNACSPREYREAKS